MWLWTVAKIRREKERVKKKSYPLIKVLMPFVQSSNDQTTKLLLYTVNRSTGTVQSPSWDVQVPLQIPPHHTALCSVESFITSAPSLFDSSYFTVGVNMCMKETLSLATYTDCWNTADVVGGVSLQSIFLKTPTMDMTNVINLATVLVVWVQKKTSSVYK